MTSKQSLTIVHLKRSYKENKTQNHVTYPDIQSAMPSIMDKETSSLEVLSGQVRKIYMDVENIPFDKTEVINDIITKFAAFMKIPSDNYCLTFNKNSKERSEKKSVIC